MKEKNELLVIRIGNFFHMKRTIVEKLDAEEFLRALSGLEEQYQFMTNQIEEHKKDLDKMKKWEVSARDMRNKEVQQAKEEIRRYST